MVLEIRAVDPREEVAVRAWHEVYHAADVFERRYAAPYALDERWADLQAREKGRRSEAWLGLADGEPVVVGITEVQLLDNLSAIAVGVYTRPDRRRRGHGAAMLAHLEAWGRDRGRTIVNAETSWAYDAPADGTGVYDVEWLGRRGFVLGIVDVQQELTLPVDDLLLESIAEEAAPHHTAYRLWSFVGPVPEGIVESFAALEATIATEAPTGGLHLEPEAVDVEDLRDGEATLARQGRTKYNTVALDAAGEVVAYTDLVTSVHEGGRAFQWGTLVRPADRGHRLGLAVKAANLAQLQRARPDLTRMTTYNAEVNAPMLGVNHALGFRPVERLGEFQKRLDG